MNNPHATLDDIGRGKFEGVFIRLSSQTPCHGHPFLCESSLNDGLVLPIESVKVSLGVVVWLGGRAVGMSDAELERSLEIFGFKIDDEGFSAGFVAVVNW